MTLRKLSVVCGLLFVLAVSAIVFSPSLLGQSAGTGALTGTVTDPTGGVVPGASVTLTSTDTNQVRTATTGGDGNYKFALLPPGTYRIRFGASGFKTAEISGVIVNVTETPVLDRALEIGSQSEQVTVEAQTESLQTATSTLGSTVGNRTVTVLPLSSRNYTQILALSAGTNTGANNATALGKGTQNMSVNGNDPGQNNFQMDGVNITNFANSNHAGDLGQQYGPSTFSRPQRFVANYSYDLPFGKHTGFLDRLASGWNISGVTVLQGGSPMIIADQTAGTLFGTSGTSQAGFGRAQMAPGMTYADIATPGDVEQRLGGASGGPGWFNKAAFIAPPAMSPTGSVYYSVPGSTGQAQCAAANPGITCGTLFGNSGTGIIKGLGQFNFDLSILKTTRILESHTLQFRAEFFNAFNHAQFTNPNYGQGALYALPNFAAGNFGQITSTSVNPRIIQLALKYIF